jgi:hypothetical protein
LTASKHFRDAQPVSSHYGSGAYILQNGRRWSPDEPETPPPVRSFEPPPVKPQPAPELWRNGTVHRLLADGTRGFVVPDGMSKNHNDIVFHIARAGRGAMALTVGARVRFTTVPDPQKLGQRLINRIEALEG